MLFAGEQPGQVRITMFEFIDSDYFKESIQTHLQAISESIENVSTNNPKSLQYMKAPSLVTGLSLPSKAYIKWANSNIEEFVKDYRGYIQKLTGLNPGFVGQSTEGVKAVHRLIMHNVLPLWLDKKLNRQTAWHIDNTDPTQEYDLQSIRERYGIGKNKAGYPSPLLEQGSNGRIGEKSNSKIKQNDRNGVPGIRTLSDEDLELF